MSFYCSSLFGGLPCFRGSTPTGQNRLQSPSNLRKAAPSDEFAHLWSVTFSTVALVIRYPRPALVRRLSRGRCNNKGSRNFVRRMRLKSASDMLSSNARRCCAVFPKIVLGNQSGKYLTGWCQHRRLYHRSNRITHEITTCRGVAKQCNTPPYCSLKDVHCLERYSRRRERVEGSPRAWKNGVRSSS